MPGVGEYYLHRVTMASLHFRIAGGCVRSIDQVCYEAVHSIDVVVVVSMSVHDMAEYYS